MNDLNYKLKKKEKSVKDDQCERLYIDFLKCVQMNGDISHEQFLNMLVDLCANGQKDFYKNYTYYAMGKTIGGILKDM